MGGGSSNKPIVFVFGTKKGDADARKKNLSAINTQVAYRAHERRREKKNKQRAQAKEEEKVDQRTPLNDASASGFAKVDDINFVSVVPEQAQQRTAEIVAHPATSQGFSSSHIRYETADKTHSANAFHAGSQLRPHNSRRESDHSSDSNSERDAVWSLSPSPHRNSTPATDLSSTSPSGPAQLNHHFDKALDPFFKLPTVASEREKWLVHFCMFWLNLVFSID